MKNILKYVKNNISRHSIDRVDYRMVQQIPEFIGFLSNLGMNPTKNPFVPDYIHIF
jgi:hypothetical protein